MEKVVHISLKQGNHQMDMNAPTPSDVSVPKTEPTSERHTSAVGVTIAGAGGKPVA